MLVSFLQIQVDVNNKRTVRIMPPHLLVLILGILTQVAISFRMGDEEGYQYKLLRVRPSEFFNTPRPDIIRRQWAQTGGGSLYIRRNKEPRRPGQKQLKRKMLLNILGDDFKEGLMSIDKPADIDRKVRSLKVHIEKDPSWASESLPNQLKLDFNLTAELEPELIPYQSQIRNWLLRRASCPIEFSWKDMGELFWPRWVRRGECPSKDGLCSFPRGMNCVPGPATSVQILSWTCIKNNHRNKRDSYPGESVLYKRRVPPLQPSKERKRKKCDWKKIPFSITTECFCTC